MRILLISFSSIIFQDGLQSWVDTLIQFAYFSQGPFSGRLPWQWFFLAWCLWQICVIISGTLPDFICISVDSSQGLTSIWGFIKVEFLWYALIYLLGIIVIGPERIRHVSLWCIVLGDILFLVCFWNMAIFLILHCFCIRSCIKLIELFFEHLGLLNQRFSPLFGGIFVLSWGQRRFLWSDLDSFNLRRRILSFGFVSFERVLDRIEGLLKIFVFVLSTFSINVKPFFGHFVSTSVWGSRWGLLQ